MEGMYDRKSIIDGVALYYCMSWLGCRLCRIGYQVTRSRIVAECGAVEKVGSSEVEVSSLRLRPGNCYYYFLFKDFQSQWISLRIPL